MNLRYKTYPGGGSSYRFPWLEGWIDSLRHPRATCEDCLRRIWMPPRRWETALVYVSVLCDDCVTRLEDDMAKRMDEIIR